MAWTEPRTWADDEVPTAAIMNAHVRDNVKYLYDNKQDVVTEITYPSRSSGVEYTNNTGKLMFVMVTCTEDGAWLEAYVGGSVRVKDFSWSNYGPNIAFFVAPGETYKVSVTGTLKKWAEIILGKDNQEGWTEPRTWADDEVVTAAMLNVNVSDNLAYLKDNKLGASATASQSLPSRLWNTKYTNNTGKFLYVLITLELAYHSGTKPGARILINDIEVAGKIRQDTFNTTIVTTLSVLLSPGDTYELRRDTVMGVTVDGVNTIFSCWTETEIG